MKHHVTPATVPSQCERGKDMSTKDYLNTNLNGKTIVFTGGTDGMGKAAVEKLAKMGAEIMLLGSILPVNYTLTDTQRGIIL